MKELWDEYRRQGWTERVFRYSWMTAAGVAGATVLFIIAVVRTRRPFVPDVADTLLFILLISAPFLIVPNVFGVLVWLTKRLERGFQRVAVVVYPLSFLFFLYDYEFFRWVRYKEIDHVLTHIFWATFYTCLTVVLFIAMVNIGRWIASGFEKEH